MHGKGRSTAFPLISSFRHTERNRAAKPMRLSAVRLRWLFLVVALWAVVHIAYASGQPAGEDEQIPGSVRFVAGVLPEATAIARRRPRISGEWSYHFRNGQEKVLFAEEDAAALQWEQRKDDLRLLRLHRLQQLQRMRENVFAEREDVAADPAEARDASLSGLPLREDFTERKVLQRRAERRERQSQFNLSDPHDASAALGGIADEISSLWRRLHLAGTQEAGDTSGYGSVLQRHFSHTLAHESAPYTSPRWPPKLISSPCLWEADILPLVEQEVSHLRRLWERLLNNRSATMLPDESPVEKVERELERLSSLIEESRRSVGQVVLLAEALVDRALHGVSLSFTELRSAIVRNDESTEAKRTELKRLLKQQTRLRLIKAALEKHRKVFANAVHREELPGAEANLFALHLLARLRYGDEVEGVMEALPSFSVTAPLTGLVEDEWQAHVVLPYGVCILVTVIMVCVGEAVKECCISQLRRARLLARGVAAAAPFTVRAVFRIASLMGLVLPPLLPFMILVIHLRGVEMWAWAVLSLMRPGQRVCCAMLFLFLVLFNCLVGGLAKRLFAKVTPSARRRHLAKTK